MKSLNKYIMKKLQQRNTSLKTLACFHPATKVLRLSTARFTVDLVFSELQIADFREY